jgi:hypothetical protein
MIFEDINEYMKRSRDERRAHLLLDEACIEIGGLSQFYRGLLAHYLRTTIGDASVYVCHACNNPKCSNPKHLYWGTPTDNIIDQKESGTWKSGYQKIVDKHGVEKAHEMLKQRASRGGKLGGGHNRLSDEQLSNWKATIESVSLNKRGRISELGRKMNCSHTQVKRILNKYFPNVLLGQVLETDSNDRKD